MSGVYSYVSGYWSGKKAKKIRASEETGGTMNSSDTTSLRIQNGDGSHVDERTSLLVETDQPDDDALHSLSDASPSVKDFYFSSDNPTVQRYYRFSATPITPIVALHKKPGTGSSAIITSGVTGLLRRSAVVPSHGTDTTGEWILVSVGGRSGWARKKLPHQHFSGFTLAKSFAATEGWMGNHAFLCNGKIMLGSDAPSLFFTNVLLIVGYILHFLIILPRLRVIEEDHEPAMLFLRTDTIFWVSAVLGVSTVITLWISAMMDPGILPPVSSPIKAPVPGNGVPLGGPLGHRYCSTCNIFRPPRGKHCNSCNVCVSKFDQYVRKRMFVCMVALYPFRFLTTLYLLLYSVTVRGLETALESATIESFFSFLSAYLE